MQDFTLHTHSVGFDGHNTPAQMVARAAELGFRTIGISNHFIVHPRIKESQMYAAACTKGRAWSDIYSSSFDEVMARFVPHYADMASVAAASDIRVLRGMEVDWFDDDAWRAGFSAALRELKPDYLICAKHIVEFDGLLYNTHDMERAPVEIQNLVLAKYWENIGAAAKSGLFNFMAHLNLPKKVGLGDDAHWAAAENAALDAIARSNTAIEINTSGIGRFGTPYPSARILSGAAKRGVPILLSDDAHRAEQIGRDFDVAMSVAYATGVKRLASLDEILKLR